MQEALAEAEKYAPRCEALAARMEEGRGVLERARAEQVERARAAEEAEAEAAAALAEAAAEAAAQRLRMEERRAALVERQATLQETQSALALELQQMDAQLGVEAPAAPAVEEEALCVVCMDAPTSHAVLPCMHQCVCAACAQQLQEQGTQSCPVCRGPVERIAQVFTS
jgi:rRNA maturation endonuclease Nob1